MPKIKIPTTRFRNGGVFYDRIINNSVINNILKCKLRLNIRYRLNNILQTTDSRVSRRK